MEEIESLIQEILTCEECRVEPAVQKIAGFGSTAIPYLLDLLEHPQADVRWWAIWALGEIPDPQVPGRLIEALNDPAPQVKQAAVLALRQQPDPTAIPALIEALGSPDAILVRLASAALIALGREAVLPLIDALENPSAQVRMEAVRALAHIGDERSVPALFHALDKDSALMEIWASEGLERMGIGMRFFKP